MHTVAYVFRTPFFLGPLLKSHQVDVLVWRACLSATIGFLVGDDLSPVSVNKLTSLQVLWTTKSWLLGQQGLEDLQHEDVPQPLFVVLKISSPTFLPCCTTRFLQLLPQLQRLLHSKIWFLPLRKASLRQAVLNLAWEYGNSFLPEESSESSRHSQDKYSHPIWRPLSFRHLHPFMNSSDTCWTPSLRTFLVTNWKSRGGDVSSIVLTTDTLSRIERFSINRYRRSLGDGCGGGTITAGLFLWKEIRGFERNKCGFFSLIFEFLKLLTIEQD